MIGTHLLIALRISSGLALCNAGRYYPKMEMNYIFWGLTAFDTLHKFEMVCHHVCYGYTTFYDSYFEFLSKLFNHSSSKMHAHSKVELKISCKNLPYSPAQVILFAKDA